MVERLQNSIMDMTLEQNKNDHEDKLRRKWRINWDNLIFLKLTKKKKELIYELERYDISGSLVLWELWEFLKSNEEYELSWGFWAEDQGLGLFWGFIRQYLSV